MCACQLETETLDNATIYTTVYPVNYITKVLYGEYSENISSIYPSDCNYETYKLNKKQVKEFAKGDLFIYNGLTSEKEVAKTLLNKNSNLLIIDVANGLVLNNDMTELWLSPNNYLMLAKNVKNNLQEYINNKSVNDGIEANYKDFEENVSIMDANLHEIGHNASLNGSNIIVSSNNTFKFLENYGFSVISLEDENNLKTNKLNTIKSNFTSGKYKYILTLDTDEGNETINDLVNNFEAKTIIVDSLTLSSDFDYFDFMNSFIKNIETITE